VDPITLILIGTSGAAAAGVAAAVGPLWRQWRQRKARELVQRPIIGAQAGSDAPRSVYDVFQDLGSDDFALEVMRHMRLIPDREEDLETVASNLSDAIGSFGGYTELISSLRETIEEMAEEREKGESRKSRLTLVAPKQTESLLPAVNRPEGLPPTPEIQQLEARINSARRGVFTAEGSDDEPHLHATVDEALAALFGAGRSPQAGSLQDGSGSIAAIVIGGVLGSLTAGGNFWDGVSRFVHKRRVKQMRSKLNEQLAGLSLDLFHAPQEIAQQVEHNLSLIIQHKRWTVERQRREISKYRKLPRKQRRPTDQALKLLSIEEARESLAQAEREVRKLQTQITRHRRSGKHALAGFLIYVNRKDMLHGVEFFDARIRAIEEAGEQLREALLAEIPTSDDFLGAPPPALPRG
jgi:hypothetical protein